MGQGPGIREFNRLYKELDDLYHNLALRQGLSDSASIILYALYLLGDGCLQRDICDLSYISKQTINSSIRRLEQDGYLYLQPGRGRDMHICLTPEGRRLVEEKAAPVAAMEERAFSGHAAGGPAGPSESDARLSCPPAGRGPDAPVNFHIPSEGGMAAAIQPEKMTSALGFGNPGAIFLPRGHARGTFIPTVSRSSIL